MEQRSLASKLIATLVIVSLQAAMGPALAAQSGATVRGSIVLADAETPLQGAKLHLGDPKSGMIYSSEATDGDGTFEIESIPPATYELAVESGQGLYLVQTPITLASGQSQAVNVAIRPQVALDPGAEEKGSKKKSGAGVWNNPLTAALIVLGAAIVLGVVIDQATDEDEQVASPS